MTSDAKLYLVIISFILLGWEKQIVVAVQCPCGIVLPPSKKAEIQFNIISCISSSIYMPRKEQQWVGSQLKLYLVSFTHTYYAELITLILFLIRKVIDTT